MSLSYEQFPRLDNAWDVESSRGPFRPQGFIISPPRASAFGLSPGLHSPGPLGRTKPAAQDLGCEFPNTLSGKARFLVQIFGRQTEGVHAIICQAGEEDDSWNACEVSGGSGRKAPELEKLHGCRHAERLFGLTCRDLQGQESLIRDLHRDAAHSGYSSRFGSSAVRGLSLL